MNEHQKKDTDNNHSMFFFIPIYIPLMLYLFISGFILLLLKPIASLIWAWEFLNLQIKISMAEAQIRCNDKQNNEDLEEYIENLDDRAERISFSLEKPTNE